MINQQIIEQRDKNNLKIGIVTIPISKAGVTPLLNLIDIICHFSDKIFIITGNEFAKISLHDKKVNASLIYHNYDLKGTSKIIGLVSLQLKIFFKLLTTARKVDFFIFFIGTSLVLPILASKVLNKEVILLLPGYSSKASKSRGSPFSKLLYIIERIDFFLSDRIIVYSMNLIKECNLEKYKHKIIIGHEHFVDFTKFTIKKKIDERPNLVGYIGRLSEEKGILNLIGAMPLVLKKRADTRFVICGEGSLTNEVENIIKAEGVEAHVRLMRWIAHEDVPRYLNELRLLVLPSFTEGLPNVVLEAMACGTPVLATPVGAVPDVIKDGETGFLLKSNDPEHIADRIVELLGKPELLEKVSGNAYNYVRENFSYEKTLEAWRKMLEQLKMTN